MLHDTEFYDFLLSARREAWLQQIDVLNVKEAYPRDCAPRYITDLQFALGDAQAQFEDAMEAASLRTLWCVQCGRETHGRYYCPDCRGEDER